MGHRLSKIYTRTGDDGTTGLGDGSRIEKDHHRMESIGTVDELNSAIGLLLAELPSDDAYAALLAQIQHDLFDLGGELAVPGYTMISASRISELESKLDCLNEDLPPLKNFILPGGSKPAALCHMARAICRRAERCLVALSKTDEVNTTGRQYLNRLSDFLFVMARLLARRNGGQEVLWQQADKR
ncbi:Cobalamin adenosyltransferase [Zhongshania aliphaticivorans]|uniref:Corrinoid adenosyltransferase n=1 Tax=Zhongshania aliphaticivorans TaxID=1470434 RepID=A0A5S9N195_9GAMM|nr:cob(I)yrinic acid a,c-diamide adenosyltransferase [Zhongshania aliphaticivorans]CAA0082951.1 Cobalamin adenosyltransferase [Zhongshania aliphaticivorans]CAA0083846.1 Cobalamin adenosyltransferase [Zhongshania aliphaticivorans]